MHITLTASDGTVHGKVCVGNALHICKVWINGKKLHEAELADFNMPVGAVIIVIHCKIGSLDLQFTKKFD